MLVQGINRGKKLQINCGKTEGMTCRFLHKLRDSSSELVGEAESVSSLNENRERVF